MSTKTLNEWRDDIHQLAVEKGGWPEVSETHAAVHVALAHSEVSEILEVLRAPELDREHLAEEIGDAIGRLLDIAGAFSIDVEASLRRKHEKNRHREFLHGKKF